MDAKKTILVLIAILLLGLLLRIHDLTTESLWLDEGQSIKMASLEPFHIIKQCTKDNHPPLYYIILHYWIKIFGDSEFSVRFLSVLFGFIALIVVYKLGSLLFNRRAGLLSALLMSTSVFYIANSQDAKMYCLGVLLTLSSMYFFIKLFDKRDIAISAGYILSTFLLISTLYLGFFIILVQHIFLITVLLLSKGRYNINFKKWFTMQFILLIAYMPWLYFPISRLMDIASNPTAISETQIAPSVISAIKIFAGSHPSFFVFIVVAAISLIPAGARDTRNITFSYFKKIYFLTLWLFIPTVIILWFIIFRWKFFFLAARYLTLGSMAFYLLVAQGINNIRMRYLRITAICVVITVSLITTCSYYVRTTKNQWREVAWYIDENAKPWDVLLFHKGYFQENVFDYYSEKQDLIKIPLPEQTRKIPMKMKEIVIGINEKDIEKAWPRIKSRDRVWLILCHDRDRKGLIKKKLRKTFKESHVKKYFGIEVYLFEKT
ncbi:MAG: glycosyltransferase family 39 protein [Candidatus Omnitrophica bacterium]|nr:glycosyltransferase family 39 protein [Candidatus Omnitrophota bacterium]